jgi:hypothetical protein
VISIAPQEWIAAHPVQCPDSGGIFVLPDNLPLLEGSVEDDNPGWARSPYNASNPIPVEKERWRPGEIVECLATQRKFTLPQSLPEWIEEAHVEDPGLGFVTHPDDPASPFRVQGNLWSPGAIVRCPGTGKKLRLPADVGALDAILVEGRIGYVQSPYDPEAKPQKVAASEWQPGAAIECSTTGRMMQLPAHLPRLPTSNVLLKQLAIAAVLALIIGGGLLAIRGKSEPALPDGTKTEYVSFGNVLQFPERVIFVQGIEPKGAKVFLEAGQSRLPADASISGTSTVVAIPKEWSRAPSLKIVIEVDAKNSESIALVPGAALVAQIAKRFGQAATAATPVVPVVPTAPPPPATGTVTWNPKDAFFGAIASKIKFRRGQDDPITVAFQEGKQELAPGEYSVGLVVNNDRWENPMLPEKLTVAAGSKATVPFPPALPRCLIGIERVTGRTLRCFVAGDHSMTDAGRLVDVKFDYWSPCVIQFDSGFENGYLADENALLSVDGVIYLDQAARLVIVHEQQVTKKAGRAIDNPAYKTTRPILDQFVALFARDADELRPSDLDALFKQRETLFDLARQMQDRFNAIKVPLRKKANEPEAVNSSTWKIISESIGKTDTALASYGSIEKEFRTSVWKRITAGAINPTDSSLTAAELDRLIPTGGPSERLFLRNKFKVSRLTGDWKLVLLLESSEKSTWIFELKGNQWQLSGEDGDQKFGFKLRPVER